MNSSFLTVFTLSFVYQSIADNSAWITTRPTVMERDSKPSSGLLNTRTVGSFLQCTFVCIQNTDCLMFAFNGKNCDLFTFVFPKPSQPFVEAKGYTTYRARPKIFQTITGGINNNNGNEVCKSRLGGRLASITDLETFQTAAEAQRQFGKTVPDCYTTQIGLKPRGKTGIFEWLNGETIDVVNGTGFQRWQPTKPPVLYKTQNIVVLILCRKEFGHWEEYVGESGWATCEMP